MSKKQPEAKKTQPLKWAGWTWALGLARQPETCGPIPLIPDDYRKALTQLDHEMEGLSRGDPRYQEACRTGRLEWYDETGACVVLERA